jgi:hypothetical protein
VCAFIVMPGLHRLCTSLLLALLLCAAQPASAAYDIATRGVPQFVSTVHIELAKISRLSKFRSSAGHDYSDFTQFGTEALKDAAGKVEGCRSMKHYFVAPDSTVKVFAPVEGNISSIREGWAGHQIEITSTAQPDFRFIIFHVKIGAPLAVGQKVNEGQQLGTHIGLDTWSDIAVWVQTPSGKHLISFFETLTDSAFAAFTARGVGSRNLLVRTKEERDAQSTCFFSGSSEDFVELSGGPPSYQSVEVQTSLGATLNIGDAPWAIAATATSGLPVEVVSATPKICTTANNAVTARRPGLCKVLVTQPGDAATYEATPIRLQTAVLPRDVAIALPLLATVVPPGGAGPQSYVRFFNTGENEGTVTASLLDSATGQKVATWKSPPIPPGASPQYNIATLEGGPAAGRPAFYTLRIEPATTVTGYLQHVLFDAGREVFTNASTCDAGVMADPLRIANVHTSLLANAYPSTLILYNIGGISAGMNFTLKDTVNGTSYGRFYAGVLRSESGAFLFAYPNAQVLLANAATIETVFYPQSSPLTQTTFLPQSMHINLIDEGAIAFPGFVFKLFYQHRITSKNAGIVTDMTTACALDGRSTATANADLRVGGVLSTLNTATQSAFRLYNAGEVAGTVKLKIWGGENDQPLGSWESPEIPAHGMVEVPIATVERELRLHQVDTYIPRELRKANYYGLSVQTAIDGLFQHVLTPANGGTGGTLSNVSTCADAVTSSRRDLMAVHPGGSGHASTIVVTNTGATAAAATLKFYDARDGAVRGSYQTASIPAGGQARLGVAAMEAEAGISLGSGTSDTTPTPPMPGDDFFFFDFPFFGGGFVPMNSSSASAASTATASTISYYTVQVDEPFTGFLQHFVTDPASGAIADMSTVCMM